jgi:predicted  nucleic acid-binding Zn ribbon protein
MIEEKDGVNWIACSSEHTFYENITTFKGVVCRVYHPDAKVLDSSMNGSDDKFECPHCKKSWWMEYDG